MEITVRLYASLAEDVGRVLFDRFPPLEELRESIIYAVNAEYVQDDFPITAEDDIAIIPPVSGGAGNDPNIQISKEPLSLETLHQLVLCPEAGAVSHFLGVVRDNNLGRDVDHLEYDAYPEMAQKVMTEIANDVKKRWPINEIAIHHRIGRLEIGETSVAIAVSAPHRADGIEACHYAIDRLKTIVPIWKKEFWIDGEHWVEGSLNPKTEAKPSPKPTDTAD